jgi:hypothetical protein
LVLRPAKTEAGTLRRISAAVGSLLQLRELLRSLPRLAAVLDRAQCALLRALGAATAAPAFADLLRRLDELLDEEAAPASAAFLNRTQQCFALRGGVDPLLDVSRAAFCRATEQVGKGAHLPPIEWRGLGPGYSLCPTRPRPCLKACTCTCAGCWCGVGQAGLVR